MGLARGRIKGLAFGKDPKKHINPVTGEKLSFLFAFCQKQLIQQTCYILR